MQAQDDLSCHLPNQAASRVYDLRPLKVSKSYLQCVEGLMTKQVGESESLRAHLDQTRVHDGHQRFQLVLPDDQQMDSKQREARDGRRQQELGVSRICLRQRAAGMDDGHQWVLPVDRSQTERWADDGRLAFRGKAASGDVRRHL